MKSRTVTVALLASFALAIGPSAGAFASQDSVTTEDETLVSSAPMEVVGYDYEVAEAHGYRIETDEDGNEYPVPVTPEAIAEQAQYEAESPVQARGIVYGNCGASSLTGYKGTYDTVYFTTSFNVGYAVAEYDWRVNANGFISSNYWATSGFGGSQNRTWSGAIGAVVE